MGSKPMKFGQKFAKAENMSAGTMRVLGSDELWTQDPPTKVGKYWFFGEEFAGDLAFHFSDDYVWDPALSIVNVINRRGKLVAFTNGKRVYLEPFDKTDRSSRGYYGFWLPKGGSFVNIPKEMQAMFGDKVFEFVIGR